MAVLLQSPVHPLPPWPRDQSPASDVLAARVWVDTVADWQVPVDFSLPFVCPTLTPLFHTAMYATLSREQQRRYNQLAAISFNELIVFFEQSFSVALQSLLQESRDGDQPLRERMQTFLNDERRHGQMWKRLTDASLAGAGERSAIIRIARPIAAVLPRLAARPRMFPVVLLVMLTLEEHSIETSRRCAKIPAGTLEPHYAAAQRAHLLDEVRHVQVDRELIHLLVAPLSPWLRRINAAMYRRFIERLWLRPTSAAVRVIDALIAEYADLRPARPAFIQALRELDRSASYRNMMFSPHAALLTFSIIADYPEFNPHAGDNSSADRQGGPP